MNAINVSKIGTILLFAIGVTALPAAHAQEVDTSEWVCEFCPFASGSRADITVGASSLSDDSAYFGDASGYSEEGAYANVDGEGSYASDTHRLEWLIEDLGLDSRYAELRGGRQGTFDYNVSYRQLPRHRFFTTNSIFLQSSGDTLSLPAGWVQAPLTSGFTELGANLTPRNIESERRTMELGGRYLPSSRISLSASYRRQERDGLDIYGGSYFTQSSLLPGSFDYVTDIADFGIRYAGDNSFIALAYHLSEFESNTTALTWETPFIPTPGAEFAALAQPPDNSFQQISLSGNYRLAQHPTVIAYTAAIGSMDQDAPFLPYTTNATLAASPLPRANLAADVDTRNLAVSLTSRIFDKARLKISYRYDERDNQTAQDAWNRIITDTFVSLESETNIPYSFERSTFNLSAEYRLFDSVRVSGGYDRKTIDRDFQEVAEQTEDSGWGRLRWRPNETIQVTVRGGAAERDVDAYNETFAASLGQNPLMRKYNLAYRYRRFGELTVTASLPESPVTLTVKGMYADDEYTRSQLGLTAADELRLAADLSWALSENTSIYLSGGYENIESEQAGSEQFAAPDWRASNNDDFYTVGAGFHARQIADNFDLQLDYMRSDGTSEIELESDVSGSSRFPDIESTLDYLRLRLSYRRSERTQFDINLRYQRFEAEDWALEGVGPATIPVVLTLGAKPYDDKVLLFGIGFRYLIGGSDESITE
jgi:MtrB/PioB family decaheme-associated outer membrane protein